jgi:hypothetical protein
MSTIKEMKRQLKALALEIKEKRAVSRTSERARSLWENANPEWRKQRYDSALNKEGQLLYKGIENWTAVVRSKQFRYLHVVYCLARGRKMEQIEPKVHPGNELDMAKIEKMLAEVTYVQPEAVYLRQA